MAQFYLQPEGRHEGHTARLHRRGRGNTWPAIATYLVADMALVQNVLQVLGHDCTINDVEAKVINEAAEAKRLDPGFQAQMDTLIDPERRHKDAQKEYAPQRSVARRQGRFKG